MLLLKKSPFKGTICQTFIVFRSWGRRRECYFLKRFLFSEVIKKANNTNSDIENKRNLKKIKKKEVFCFIVSMPKMLSSHCAKHGGLHSKVSLVNADKGTNNCVSVYITKANLQNTLSFYCTLRLYILTLRIQLCKIVIFPAVCVRLCKTVVPAARVRLLFVY